MSHIVLPAIRDESTLAIGDVIERFTKLEVVERFNAPGAWAMSGPDTARNLDQLVRGAGLVVYDETDGVVFSGPVRKVQRSRSERDDVVQVQVTGQDDIHDLWHRMTPPDPQGPPYNTAEFHEIGPAAAESVIRDLIDQHAGPSAIADRRITGLTLAADAGRGLTIVVKCRWEVLGTVAAEAARRGGGLHFTLRQSGATKALAFRATDDLTGSVRFSDTFQNLLSWRYDAEIPDVTYMYVGGGTDGVNREIAECECPVYGAERHESFLNERSITSADADYLDLLRAAGTAKLEETAGGLDVAVVIRDDDRFKFRRDYDLGDTVSVEIEGATLDLQVREAKTTWADGAPKRVAVALGTPGASTIQLLPWSQAARDLSRRVSRLEAR